MQAMPRSKDSSFNPRPPFPGGDALPVVMDMPLQHMVSIHAPRFREAMLEIDTDAGRVGAVSIHAPRFREAMHWPQATVTRRSTFQSTPPVSGRRCPPTLGNA